MNLSGSDASSAAGGSSPIVAVVVLLALGLIMLATDRYFTFFEDEVRIVCAAANPVSQTVNLFLHGTGQHEHPPLYDFLLHGWLKLTGGSMGLLRLPSIGFYLLGIWVLVTAAGNLCGSKAAGATLWISVLWPYGFHFGRVAAWYSLSFLLVAILTDRYLALSRVRTFKNWLLTVIPAILLLYTNYYGWAILACLFADFPLLTRRELSRRWGLSLATALLLIIAFLPLLRAFMAEVETGAGIHEPALGTGFFEAFNVYSLFSSESVAPWHWALGIPVCIAIAVCVIVVLLHAPPIARRLFVYFLLLITAMAVIGIIGTKRLLLISAWAVFPVGLCLGTIRSRRWKALLLVSLIVIAGVGWFGTISRRYYAAPRFIEPWPKIAAQMAVAVRNGATVVATHPSFFFYITYELHRLDKPSPLNLSEVYPYGGEQQGLYDLGGWEEKDRPVSAHVYVVKDVSSGDSFDEVESFLNTSCAFEGTNRFLPDSGFDLKRRFMPGVPRVRFRIEIRQYKCK